MLDVLSENGDTKERALVSKNIISGKGSTFNRDENAEDLPSKVKDGPVDVNKTYKIGSILAEAFYNFNKGKERDRYKESTKIAPNPQSRALERVNLPQKKLTRGGSESSGGLFDGIGSAIDSIQDIVDNVKSAKKLLSFTKKRGVKGLRRLASRKIGRSKIGRLAGRKVAPKAVAKTAEKVASKAIAQTAEKVAPKAVAKTAEKVASKAIAQTAGKAATKTVAKTAGKSLLKAGLKKIPFVGAGAGALFAAQRAMQGDFLGAGLELVSGISSIIPGLGTAVSVGADALLAAKDIKAASKTAEKAAPKVAAVAATKSAGRAAVASRVGSGILGKVVAPIALAVDGVTAVTKLSTESGRANLRQQAEQFDFTKNFWGTLGKSILSPLETASAIGLSVKDLLVSTKGAKKSEENLKSQLESRGVASTEELYAKKQKEMLGKWDVNRDGILDKSEKLQRQLDLRSKRTAGNIDSGKVSVNTPPSIQPNITPMVPPKREVVGKVDMPSVKPSTPIVDVDLNDQNSLIKQQTNVMLAILDVAKKQLLSKGGEASIAPPVINVSPQQPQRENVTFTNGRDIYLSSPYSLT